MERPDDRNPRSETIQPDPQLQLSQGHATGLQIALVAFACMLIVGMMIYGLNQPVTENITASPPQETTGGAPAAAPPQDQQQQDQQPQQPVPQQTKPGAVEDDSKR